MKSYAKMTATELIIRAQKGDRKAMNKLMQLNKGFIYQVAWHHHAMNTHVEFDDILTAVMMGFCKAVMRFDPTSKNNLICYAVWWMRHEAQLELHANNTVRVPIGEYIKAYKARKAGLNPEPFLPKYIHLNRPDRDGCCFDLAGPLEEYQDGPSKLLMKMDITGNRKRAVELYCQGLNQTEIGQIMKLSRERVRQLLLLVSRKARRHKKVYHGG